KLQGMEALYLSRKAGFHTVLMDKNFDSPAKNLCDQFLCCDIFSNEEGMIRALLEADFVLPAMENDKVLERLIELAETYKFILAFDPKAYKISSSKLQSDRLFRENGISIPAYYPACEPPYIAKPSSESGSTGVTYLESRDAVENFLKNQNPDNWIIQEFVTGPSYSIEIIGRPGNYRTYEVTQIHMDDVYDCKMVSAPCPISEAQRKGFSDMAVKIAQLIGLHGIMDLEVIDHEGVFKLLEIDARIPSQTPITVYHATGMNFMEELRDLFCYDTFKSIYRQQKCFATFEHYLMSKGHFEEHGEHIMSQGDPLVFRENFYGADEVLSDYEEGKAQWRGTFINYHETFRGLQEKRATMQRQLGEKV
ncbi:MAG: 3-methylornithine--L-lysine ligase PylC, partial [Anaerovorax sp.]